jgi:hypothetical protein
MIVAYVTSITLLPALLEVVNPPGEKEPLGYHVLAPIDHFTERHRIPIVVGTLGITIAGLPLLYFLQFDFNPMNLRSPKVESIATYLDLRRDPATGASAIDVLAHRWRLREMRALVEGARGIAVVTLRFVPDDQKPSSRSSRRSPRSVRPWGRPSPLPEKREHRSARTREEFLTT